MSDVNYERRKAVANAWKNEKKLISEGKGTRDWNRKEQKEILLTGKAQGYEGHHMKSVDGHNSKAGDANNIQFLNRKEHLAAHGGNFRNHTNGYYDHETGKMHSFGRNKASIESRSLSAPLSESQRKNITTAKGTNKQVDEARAKAKSMQAREVKKAKSSAQSDSRRGESAQSKTLARQRTTSQAGTKETATKSKTLSKQREAAKTASGGKKSSSESKKTKGH